MLLLRIVLTFVLPNWVQQFENSQNHSIMTGKPTFLGLRTSIYQVADLEKATTWYSQAFGKAPYFEESFYVGFNIGGYELGLQPEEEAAEKVASVVTYWGVEALEATYQHLLELGATANEAPYSVGGAIRTATVKDPWGNLIGLIYNPDFQLTD